MRASTRIWRGAVIIAVVASAFALTGSAGSNISPVADQIAYMSMLDGEADIYTMTPTGLMKFNLTHDKTTGMRADVEPAWSPDGSFVAFQRNFTKGDLWGSQLYLVAADGTKLGPVMPPLKGVVDMHPTWSPDGQSLVFSSDRDGNFDLYAYRTSTAQVVQLTNTKPGIDNLQPAWSPDGRMIVFSRRVAATTPSPASLFVLRVGKGLVYKLAPQAVMGLGDRDPVWSPNSKQIAFTSDRLGSSITRSDDLYVVSVTGAGLTRITMLASNESHPTWSPYGDQLAFISDRTGATEIYSMRLPVAGTTAPSDKIEQLTFDGAYKSSPTWHGRIGMFPIN